MQYITTTVVILVGLITIGSTVISRAATQENAHLSLSSIGERALATCTNLSTRISKSAVMAKLKSNMSLMIYAGRINTMAEKIGATTPTSNDTPASQADVQAILKKAVPTVKKLLIQLLDLPEAIAATFWQTHGTQITAELENTLRTRLTAPHAIYMKNMLEQEHFAEFIQIIGDVLRQHITVAPADDKAAVAALRDSIIKNTVS